MEHLSSAVRVAQVCRSQRGGDGEETEMIIVLVLTVVLLVCISLVMVVLVDLFPSGERE